MKTFLPLLALFFFQLTPAFGVDARDQPPKDLNGYFPCHAPDSLDDWNARKEFVRRQILVAEGLWPMPTKNPLNAVIHGAIDCGAYTVERVYFESTPGFFVTGNLYRPKGIRGRVPGVMFAHGHWKDARLSEETGAKVRAEIASGQERFEKGGRSRFQSMCVQLARMGCVVWQWDMLGDSDSVQLSREVVHSFAKQRPEMNSVENWGLYSPQAEAHAQSIMGLQTLNAVRGLDFLLSLPEVDPQRTAITGASGGGTQAMLLAAIDDRIKLSFPVVMVSTGMQGGCTCENACLLRVNTGNVEFAALFAPKPQGMNTANDWTRELATKGFPDLQKLYAAYGRKDDLFLTRGEHFPHNYNAVTRSAFFTFLNKQFNLGFETPVIEQDFEPLSREQLTVWDASHPAPKAGDPAFERGLLRSLSEDADHQLRSLSATPEGLKQNVGRAVEVLIGRTFSDAGIVDWDPGAKVDKGAYIEMSGRLKNKTYGEEVAVVWLYPKKWNGKAVLWLGERGKETFRDGAASLHKEVQRLIDSGAMVIGADLYRQNAPSSSQVRIVDNPREFAGYTFGYNHSLFAQRVHDVFSLVTFLRKGRVGTHPNPTSVAVVGLGATGPIALAARALAGGAIDRLAVETNQFRFGKIVDYRDPMFLPGGAKYLDLPGMIALNAPHALWLAGEGNGGALVNAAYRDNPEKLKAVMGNALDHGSTASEWVLE